MFIKIIILGIIVCIINLLLKQHQSIFILPVNIIYITIVITLLFNELTDSLLDVAQLFQVSKTVSKVLICLYKSASICILSKIATDICKESGNTVVSDMIDLGGRLVMLSIALPFIRSIVKTAVAFVK